MRVHERVFDSGVLEETEDVEKLVVSGVLYSTVWRVGRNVIKCKVHGIAIVSYQGDRYNVLKVVHPSCFELNILRIVSHRDLFLIHSSFLFLLSPLY